MHATSVLFHSKTSSNKNIELKLKTLMHKIADTWLFLFWPFASKQSMRWVCCCCCCASIFIISSFWLSSLRLNFKSSFLCTLSLSDFSFRNCTTSDADLLPFFAVWAFSSLFHPNAQRLACSASPLLPFQHSCYHLVGFSHPWPPSLSLWFLLTLCLGLVSLQSIPEAASSILIFAFYFCCSDVSLSLTLLFDTVNLG